MLTKRVSTIMAMAAFAAIGSVGTTTGQSVDFYPTRRPNGDGSPSRASYPAPKDRTQGTRERERRIRQRAKRAAA